MTQACPCCGQALSDRLRAPQDLIAALPLGRIERRIADVFVRNFGRFVKGKQIVEEVYRDDPNGGPDWAEHTIASLCRILRLKLAAVGLRIEGRSNVGRRLVWAAAPLIDATSLRRAT